MACEVAHAAWDYLSWVDVVPESRWDVLDLLEEGIIDRRTADTLLEMIDAPTDLTGASPEVLRTVAGTWSGESEAIVRHAREEGWFESLTTAARKSRLTPPELRRLRLLAREPQWDPAALVGARTVTGDGLAEVEMDPEGRADPAALVRARAALWDTYHLGFLAVEDDDGGSLLRKYYAAAEQSEGLLRRAVVGTYRASFGEGLVLSTYRRGAHGLFYDTIKERRYRGVAATSAAGPVEWTVLYSRERRSGEDERVRVWAGNAHATAGGNWRLGGVYCRTDDEPDPVDDLGVYWRGRAGRWYVVGEMAGALDGHPGAYGELQTAVAGLSVRTSLRHYGRLFAAPQGRPFAEGGGTPDARNEAGLYLEAKTGARQWYGLRGSLDVWGSASLDSVRGEATLEAVAWRGGWELSAGAAHRPGTDEGMERRTRLSSRLRWQWRRLVAQVYGRMVDPGGTGHVELRGSSTAGFGATLELRGKIDLGRRIGGRSWHEVLVSGNVWGKLSMRAAHRLGWERQTEGGHRRWQLVRAELSASL